MERSFQPKTLLVTTPHLLYRELATKLNGIQLVKGNPISRAYWQLAQAIESRWMHRSKMLKATDNLRHVAGKRLGYNDMFDVDQRPSGSTKRENAAWIQRCLLNKAHARRYNHVDLELCQVLSECLVVVHNLEPTPWVQHYKYAPVPTASR